jgi:hypothetical protein
VSRKLIYQQFHYDVGAAAADAAADDYNNINNNK